MDIKEVLESEEGKAAISKLIEQATEGLKSKNEELLGDKKKLKSELSSIQEQINAIKEEKEAAETAAAEKSGDVEKIKATLEAKHKKELEALAAQVNDGKSKLHGLLVENGLTDALTKAGVAPQYLDAVKSLVTTKHKAEIVDNEGVVSATLDGQPLSEFVTQWAQGEQGKHFIAAPANGGGGTGGANGGGKASVDVKRSEMSHVQKAAYIKEHGQDAYSKLPN